MSKSIQNRISNVCVCVYHVNGCTKITFFDEAKTRVNYGVKITNKVFLSFTLAHKILIFLAPVHNPQILTEDMDTFPVSLVQRVKGV